MKVDYVYEEPVVRPVREARFTATGGAPMKVYTVLTQRVRIVLDYLQATFDKQDLAQFIEVLQKFHDQLPD